jgi:hypothetical protein
MRRIPSFSRKIIRTNLKSPFQIWSSNNDLTLLKQIEGVSHWPYCQENESIVVIWDVSEHHQVVWGGQIWSVLFESLGCNSESHMHVHIMIIVDQRKYMEASLLTAIGFWIQGLVMSQTGNQLRVLWIVSVLLRKFHLASEDMEFIVLHNDFYSVSLMIWMNEFMVSLPLNLWSFCCQSHLCLCSKPVDSFVFFCDVAVDRVCGSDGVTYWWVNLSLQFSSQCIAIEIGIHVFRSNAAEGNLSYKVMTCNDKMGLKTTVEKIVCRFACLCIQFWILVFRCGAAEAQCAGVEVAHEGYCEIWKVSDEVGSTGSHAAQSLQLVHMVLLLLAGLLIVGGLAWLQNHVGSEP